VTLLETTRRVREHDALAAERDRAAVSLQDQEERLRLAIDATEIGAFDFYPQTGRLVWSPNAKAHIELPPDAEVNYETFLRGLHPEDRDRVHDIVQRVQHPVGGGRYATEYRTIGIEDGKERWLSAWGRVFFDSNRQAIRFIGMTLDITERKSMEERLRSIAQFPDENPSPVLRLASDGQVLYANAAAATLLADMTVDGTCPTVLHQAMEETLSAAKERELELTTPKGRIVSFFCVPVLERHYVNLYGRDMTEVKQAERALQESERRFRGTFENAAVGIAQIDLDGRFLLVNERFGRMLGREPQELRGQRFSDLTHPQDRARDTSRFMAMLRGETESQVLEKYLRLDGSAFWVQVTRSLQRDEADKPAYVISMVQDISDRRHAEATLRQSEVFYRQTLESIPGMVFTTRPDGYCDYQSQQWVDYSGVPMSEMLGEGWNALLHPEDQPRALAAWRAAVAGSAPHDLEYRVRRHDGRYEWVKVIGRPIHDEAREVVKWFGVALNIEDLRRAQDALERPGTPGSKRS